MMPRQHAQKIIELKTKGERQLYLKQNVPDRFKKWVESYARQWWPMRQARLKMDLIPMPAKMKRVVLKTKPTIQTFNGSSWMDHN